MDIRKMILPLFIVAANAMELSAEVILPSVFSDGMVLQRGQPVILWGKASPGEKIRVSLNGKKGNGEALSDSTWTVELPSMEAGGPYVLKVNDTEVRDVLMGDLYLFSGQSNMELPVSRTLDLFKEEVASYSNPSIREFKVPKEYSFTKGSDDVSVSEWKKAEPGTSERFGALVYFTAKELYEKNGHVPVGIVNSSWGGTRIEAWLNEDALAQYPVRLHRLRIAEDEAYRGYLGKGERKARELWYSTMDSEDPGYSGDLSWSDPSYDDSGWTTVPLMGNVWGSVEGRAVNGSHWLRKTVEVPSSAIGEEAELRLGCIVDADDVWVNGHHVGSTAYQYPPRIYKIPAGVLRDGENLVCVRVISNAGVPHFVPEKPHKIIFRDGGEVSLEGYWRHKEGTPMPQTPSVTDFFQIPTVLYNAMIYPLSRLPFRGVVWYQGESDVDIRKEYCGMLRSLIGAWRAAFRDPELPFYIVELADFLHESDTYGRMSWQEMRDAQRRAADESDNAWWVMNGDIGEWNDIHPRDKKTPALRVAARILEHPHK